MLDCQYSWNPAHYMDMSQWVKMHALVDAFQTVTSQLVSLNASLGQLTSTCGHRNKRKHIYNLTKIHGLLPHSSFVRLSAIVVLDL